MMAVAQVAMVVVAAAVAVAGEAAVTVGEGDVGPLGRAWLERCRAYSR